MLLKHTIRLHGLEAAGSLSGPLLRDLLDAVDRGARGSVRLRLEGRSGTRGGPTPSWVNRAARFDVAKISEDGKGVELYAPALRDAIPERLAQYHLFEAVDARQSALGLMGVSLEEATKGNEHSDAYDEGLLGTFEDFRRVFRHGVDAVELRNGRPDAPSVSVTPAGLEMVSRLQRETPCPQRVRVAGVVDAIRHSDQAFTLVLDSGASIRGVLAEGKPDVLIPYFGRVAVVSGTAQFRPSGALLRVDAESLSPGAEGDLALWSAMPQPLAAPFSAHELRRPQRVRSGIPALLGEWPGDETEEEIFAMIAEIS
jgi:hypothetical protein